jgi:hypothetical protein
MRAIEPPEFMPGPNMTPMIDCVFLLMIFFMVSTDLASADAVELRLPSADAAVGDDDEHQKSVISVDVVDPMALPRGVAALDPARPPVLLDGRQVESLSALRAALRRRADPLKYPDRSQPVLPGIGIHPSARRLRIRCDRVQLFSWVSAIMELAGVRSGPREREESPLLRQIEVAVLEGAGGR